MTSPRSRWLPLTVLIAATAALLGSIAYAASYADRYDRGATRQCGPMMGGGYGTGSAPVRDLSDAARAAERYADRWDLRVAEVMQFSNGFYAELVDAAGAGATEVLIDPDGTVRPECGPATMWNTRYGRHPRSRVSGDATVTPDQARVIADRWLDREQPGLTAGEAESFPGYYTLHVMDGDQITGMLSVHARSGAVWYHTWHGTFIAIRE